MIVRRRYRIEVQGRLITGWEEWLKIVQLWTQEAPDGSSVTVLESSAIDQTALHGLLARIRDLNLHLLSVNPIGSVWQVEG